MMGLNMVHGEQARRSRNVAAALLGTSILAGLPCQAQAQELPLRHSALLLPHKRPLPLRLLL